MQVPVEVAYRNVEKTEVIEKLRNAKVAKLERACSHMTSCRVALERRHLSHRSGDLYRIRIKTRIPPKHILRVRRISTAA